MSRIDRPGGHDATTDELQRGPEDLERRLDVATIEHLRPTLIVVAVFYVAAGVSHFVMLPHGQAMMFAVAMACIVAQLAVYFWMRTRPNAVDYVRWLVAVPYLCLVGHSMLRLSVTHQATDLIFVGVLLIAMGLMPGRILFHSAVVIGYFVACLTLLGVTEGEQAWRSAFVPLGLAALVSMTFRALEFFRVRRIQELILTDELRRAALEESRTRFALAARGANDGLFDWHLADGWLYLSPRWREMLGYTREDQLENPDDWFALVHPDDVAGLQVALRAHCEAESTQLEHEYRIRRRDGSWAWVLCRGVCVRDEAGKGVRLAGSQTDVTARREAHDKARYEARYDLLTGLPNRVHLAERIGQCLREAGSFAVVQLDLDRFQVINDSLGHRVGDQLLRVTGQRLQVAAGPEVIVARLMGDEFAALFVGADDESAARAAADRLLSGLERPLSVEGLDFQLTAAVGILLRRPEHQSSEQVLWDSDIALNRAKRSKQRLCVFDAAMRARAVDRMNLEVELRRAFEHDEIIPWYQPIYDLEAGAARGFEALVRWKHPERGLLPPGEFLSLASETGLIYPLGRRMLDEVCRNLGDTARRDRRLFVSVNMSWTELSHREFYGRLMETLERHQFPPDRLWIEITEAVVIKQSPRTEQALRDLREAGVKVVVDDFGVGYSSLSYLQQLPVDVVKLDRSFLHDDRKDDRVLSAIVELAHGLGIRVVAEGLERPEQIELMRGLGCDFGQGHGLAGAMPLEDALRVLVNGGGQPTPSQPVRSLKAGPSAR